MSSTVVYDFDVAQLDGLPPNPRMKWRGVEPLGIVLKELAYKAVVGYGGCYSPSADNEDESEEEEEDGDGDGEGEGDAEGKNSTESPERPAADPWADLQKMDESYLECPFEEELRKMLPPTVISQRDMNSLQDKRQHINRVKFRSGKQTEGANCN